MSDPPKRSRLEDEVLEILNRTDRETPAPIKLKSSADRALWRTRLAARRSVDRLRPRIGTGGWTVILAGVAVALLANLVVDRASPFLARALLYAAVAAIVVGFVQLYRNPAGGRDGKLWRGRRVDMRRPGIDWDDKADQWRKRR